MSIQSSINQAIGTIGIVKQTKERRKKQLKNLEMSQEKHEMAKERHAAILKYKESKSFSERALGRKRNAEARKINQEVKQNKQNTSKNESDGDLNG